MRTQLIVLGVLVAAIAAILFVQSNGTPADLATTSSNRSGSSAERVEVPVVDLGLDRLTSARDALPDSERNRFRSRPKPAPPPREDARLAPPPEPQRPPPPPGPPPLPPIPLKFFGLAESQGMRVAWFSDARGNVIPGKEGDIIEGRYRVLRIGPDFAELAYHDGRGRQTLRLSGQ
jgi:hypothetical protein